MSQGEQASKTAESSELPAPADTPLDVVVKEIRSDAKRAPAQYAHDAIVPEGGE
jgi:hypothetical protein